MAKELTTNEPPLYVEERIIWHGGASALGCNVTSKQGIYHGKVCWVGRIKEVGNIWVAGVEMEKAMKGGGDGAWQTRHIFTCKAGHGLFLPAEKLVKRSELKSSKSCKASLKSLQSREKTKEESTLPAKEATFQTTRQNGPVNSKLSRSKGGTNLNKESKVNNPKNITGTDRVTKAQNQNSNAKKDGKSDSIKRNVFNTLTKKERGSQSSQDLSHHVEDQPKPVRGGFLNIFKWFSKKETIKPKKTSIEKISRGAGSTTSLVSDSSSLTFFPIRHSVSADNSNAMMKSFSKSSSALKSTPLSTQSQMGEGPCRRNSVVSIQSNTSVGSSNIRAKKRMAPQPPESTKLRVSSSASELNLGASSKGLKGLKTFEKAQSEGPVYGKIKRKAPPPPLNTDKNSMGAKSSVVVPPCSNDNSVRPLSTFSSFSSVSHSGSSSLKSSTCSENDSLTLKSDSSQKTTSSFPLSKDNKGPLSPKPWYKRKKMKSKEKVNKTSKKEKDGVYESWMPDIQFARQKVNAEPQKLKEGGNIEAFYDNGPRNGQRFSILSSISDLDRAATEQLEREKARRKAAKMNYDRAFYNVSSPHMLSQEDLLPNTEVPEGAEAVISENKIETNAVTSSYDNLQYNSNDTTNTVAASYSKQPTLKLTDTVRSNSVQNNPPSAPDINLLDDPLLTSDLYNHSESSGKINYEEYIEEIRKELEEEGGSSNSRASVSKSTPMQRAIFDPELFYQLAKDAKVNNDSKFSSSSSKQGKENAKPKTNEESEDLPSERSSPSYRLRPPQKNFGLRMNNFYTPDVSTILEGSESVTSSTTTPAEDVNEDTFNHSAMSVDQTNDFMSLNSELNSEYRINTCDLQEIIESFSMDLNRSDGEDGNTAIPEASGVNRQAKADQIRDEVLLLRERDNFLMWQKVMQGTELTRDDDDAAIQDRKKKWLCDICTLINQPWRLHCEACGSLRPPNPRRVDKDDLPPNSPDNASSHRTASTDSPMTVIHDDRTGTDLNIESNTSELGTTQNFELRNSETEVTSNTNWERELQSYFTLFDDHASAIRRTESGVRHPVPRGDSNAYGKINVSKNKFVNSVENNKGAKPKERQQNLGEGDGVDVQEIRRARIRRFHLNYSSSQEQQNFSSNSIPYNDRIVGTVIGIRDRINHLPEMSSNESESEGPLLENCLQPSKLNESSTIFQNSDERKFFRNEPKKSPVLKPSGAVKNVVSIFNQMDQLKAVQEKPPPVKIKKRRSVTMNNILNFGEFERLISGAANESNENPTPAVRANSPVMADIDIASAICKFDEMAAMAEIDSLRKPVPKVQKKKFKPEIIRGYQQNTNQINSSSDSGIVHNGFSSDCRDNILSNTPSQPTLEASKPVQYRNNANSIGNSSRLKTEDRDSCDSIIKDGILYTAGESRRRSMSIGSGTFELINAKDFASIEAHHSRRPSPTEELDVPSLLELSHPLLMPEISVETPDALKVGSNQRITEVVSEIVEEKPNTSKNAVERLSRQLTEAEGIATFKATFVDDQPKLGETNTRTISRLLKKLEDSISSGKHAEASQLAHNLAKMRLSCSVTNKSTSKGEATIDGNSSSIRPNVPTQETMIKHTHSFRNDVEANLEGAYGIDPSVCKGNLIRDEKGLSSKVTDDGQRNRNVVKRTIKIDPLRREVKSDITHRSLSHDPSLSEDKPFNVKMYVEDKSSHQGPIPLTLQSSMTVGDLKLKVLEEFGFPVEVQRWILGRLLADDDSKTLFTHKVSADGCPIFLYLVAPETDNKPTSPKLSRSSSVKSNPRSDVETTGRSKVEERIPSAKKNNETSSQHSKEKLNQESGKDETATKQDSKKAKKSNLSKKEIKHSSSNKSDVVSQNASCQPKTAPSRETGNLLSKEQERKSNKGKSSSRGAQNKISGERKSPHKTSEAQRNQSAERSVESKQISQTRVHKDANTDLSSKSKRDESTSRTPSAFDGWVCPQCTLINHKERPGCEACATDRPDDISNPGQKKKNLRQAMSALDAQGCVPNLEPFDCMVCFMYFEEGEGVVLRDCLHVFCRECLTNAVKYSDTARVKCPFSNKNYSCQFSLQDREIKDLIGEEDYKRHLDKSVKEAAGSMRNVFYCKTPDCKGFCQFEDNVNVFICDVCRKANCLTCQAQHEGVTCKQYQDDLAHKQDEEAIKTKKFFDDIIRRGDGMPCPQCSVMLVRKWGCDWMRCPMCRTEICWVTQGPRWGPEGQGDTSGGCKCGVNGRKCHPKCTYCH